MDFDNAYVISLTVVTDKEESVVKAAEVMSRAAAGLLLDGIDISLSMGRPTEDDKIDP